MLVCGRFEGVDERVIEGRNLREISIGDYILSGGEIAALTLLDACVRLLPGVMGKNESGDDESFEAGLLEYPHYTRPREWEGRTIPETLLSGDHARIARWRREQSERTDTRAAAGFIETAEGLVAPPCQKPPIWLRDRKALVGFLSWRFADLAQLVEHLIRNEGVGG